jgi:hypothetical protein
MTDTIHTNPANRTLLGRIALALVALLGALALIAATAPAEGHAKKAANFGANLKAGGYTPVASPVHCKWDSSKGCSRLPVFYAEPPHAGTAPYAPHTGVIRRIRLVAANKGRLRIQLGETSGNPNDTGRVHRNGPVIKYKGTGKIEVFKVKIPVKKFQYVGFRTKRASTLSCQGFGQDSSLQFDPPLKPGGLFQTTSWSEDCTHLIGARMRY